MKTNSEKKGLNMEFLVKYKFVLIFVAIGLVILLLPTGSKKENQVDGNKLEAPSFSLAAEEDRLEGQLGRIEGAGRVSVLLSVKGSASRELAQSGDEKLVISSGGGEEVVELYYVNPQYMGAVIVCDGATSPTVRLNIIKAISSYTGLTTDKICVMKMQ